MAWELRSSAVSSLPTPSRILLRDLPLGPHAAPTAHSITLLRASGPLPHPRAQGHICCQRPQLCLRPAFILGLQTQKGQAAGCHLQSSWHLGSLPFPLPTPHPSSLPSPHCPPVSSMDCGSHPLHLSSGWGPGLLRGSPHLPTSTELPASTLLCQPLLLSSWKVPLPWCQCVPCPSMAPPVLGAFVC